MSSFISIIKVMNNQSIAQNASEEYIVDLTRYNAEGFFSLQISLTGTGNVDVTYALSNDGNTYITPSTAEDIFTAFGASSGPGSDGNDISKINPVTISKYMKIIVTEQNAGSVVVECDMALQ